MSILETKLEKIIESLAGPFDLSSNRRREAHDFIMETQYVNFGLDGKRLGMDTYSLKLQYNPKGEFPKNVEQYTCSELKLQAGNRPAVTIPELSNWSYIFDLSLSGLDERGPLWGIPQDKFTQLSDSSGRDLPFSTRYALYNNFIDFHSISDIWSQPMMFGGKGIQDLKEMGQKIRHFTSFVEASVKFVDEIKGGSTFRNGEVTLELKGISIVDGASCALVSYDAGESVLKMIIPASDDKDSISDGGSQYQGDMYIDLASGWVRKATMDEYAITEIKIPGSSSKTNLYTTRHILLKLNG